MKKTLLAFLTLLLTSSLYAAPANDASIEVLMNMTKTESMTDMMYADFEQIIKSTLEQITKGKPQTAQQQRALDSFSSKFSAAVREEMTWAKLKPSYVQLYRETFTQDEIDGLIAFYKSPTGIAFINKMPLVMQKSIALGQSHMQTLMPKMQAALEEAEAEAKKAK